jgi:hypothetical protein
MLDARTLVRHDEQVHKMRVLQPLPILSRQPLEDRVARDLPGALDTGRMLLPHPLRLTHLPRLQPGDLRLVKRRHLTHPQDVKRVRQRLRHAPEDRTRRTHGNTWRRRSFRRSPNSTETPRTRTLTAYDHCGGISVGAGK